MAELADLADQDEMIEPMTVDSIDQKELAEQLLEQAKEQNIEMVGPDGLLGQVTKSVLETALDAEMREHLGYEKHDSAGRNSGNNRNGTRAKTVLTEIGPVEIEVPGDTASTFEPQIVKKRQRRLTGVDEIVPSLTASGLTTGEIAAHFQEVHHPPDPQHIPVRLSQVLGRDEPGSAAGLYRALRDGGERALRGVRHQVGPAVPSDQQALGERLERVHTVPGLRRRDPVRDLLHKRHLDDRQDHAPSQQDADTARPIGAAEGSEAKGNRYRGMRQEGAEGAAGGAGVGAVTGGPAGAGTGAGVVWSQG